MSDDRLDQVLSAQPRRFVRALKDDPTRDADPILRPEESLECEESVTLCYELHHVLLPKLADAGLLEFDRRGDVVTRGVHFDEISSIVEKTDAEMADIFDIVERLEHKTN